MRSCATATLLAATLLISACGPAKKEAKTDFKGEQAKVATVVDDLVTATRKRDSTLICNELLSPGSVAAIKVVQKKPCADALPDLLSAATTRKLDVTAVTITGSTATAAVTAPSTTKNDQKSVLRLRKFGPNWKLVLVGND